MDSSRIDRKSATPMTQTGLDARLYLLGKNRSAVMVMLSKARREGIDVENVAAIVADTRTDSTRQCAARYGPPLRLADGDARVDNFRNDQ